MTKEAFLKSLRTELTILKLEEIDDIVLEYESHIAEHLANGLSEEEAIEEFGNFDQLVQGILEAYNIDKDYASNYRKKVQQKEKMNDFVNKSSNTIGDMFDNVFDYINEFSSKIYSYFEKSDKARTILILALLLTFSIWIEGPWILFLGIVVMFVVHQANKQDKRATHSNDELGPEKKAENETVDGDAVTEDSIEAVNKNESETQHTPKSRPKPRRRESNTGKHLIKIILVTFLIIFFIPFIGSLFFGAIGLGAAAITLIFILVRTGLSIFATITLILIGLLIIFVTTLSLIIAILKAVMK